MILAMLAAASVAVSSVPVPARPPTPTVIVNGRPPVAAKIDMSADDDNTINLVTVWPMAAYTDKVDGQVTLSCWIDVYGLAETCHVVSESPAGKGFGAAAMQMRTTFELTPAKGPDGPIGATKTITLNFRAPNTQFDFPAMPTQVGSDVGERCGGLNKHPCPEWLVMGNPLAMRPVTMLDRPVWARAATFEDVARTYPAQAKGVDGYAVDHCRVQPTGVLTDCQIIKETPAKLGFGRAALALADHFQVASEWAHPPGGADLWVDVPIRFGAAVAAATRSVRAPIWLVGVDPDSTPQLFPPEAAAKGLTSGVGVARCTVQRDGGLADCMPQPGDPDGLGFSEAAVRLASVMKMNPWTADAAPVDGAEVEVPIQLNLKAD